MNCNHMWSMARYKPLDRTDEVSVDRVAPGETSVLLTWSGHSQAYDILFRKKGTEDAWTQMSVGEACNAELSGLDENTDYEFFVEGAGEKSAGRTWLDTSPRKWYNEHENGCAVTTAARFQQI